jgi:NAD(P)-dependent dehydrogenase (short-subunit alcohol dehydrogenase family)
MSVVLVTGSSTGIGLATALHFGRLGDGVYAGVRNIASATELTKAIEAEKLPVHPITLDVDDQGSVARAVGEVIAGVLAERRPRQQRGIGEAAGRGRAARLGEEPL